MENQKQRNGSPTFYALLERMGEVHNAKSHDYANNQNPYGNYKFAGMLSQLFKNPDDAGFVGRIGEKLYRLSNLENDAKSPMNEKIEDTEEDICVIVALWMASRRDRRKKPTLEELDNLLNPSEGLFKAIEELDNTDLQSLSDYITRLKADRHHLTSYPK